MCNNDATVSVANQFSLSLDLDTEANAIELAIQLANKAGRTVRIRDAHGTTVAIVRATGANYRVVS